MMMRTAAAIVTLAVLAALGPQARAEDHRLMPSQRALAAADDDPPEHGGRVVQKRSAVAVAMEDDTPVYKKWWFWALTAVVVGGVVAIGVATNEPIQHLPHACPAGTQTCFGDGRSQ